MIALITALAQLGGKGLELAIKLYETKYKRKYVKLQDELYKLLSVPYEERDHAEIFNTEREIKQLEETFHKEVFGAK